MDLPYDTEWQLLRRQAMGVVGYGGADRFLDLGDHSQPLAHMGQPNLETVFSRKVGAMAYRLHAPIEMLA